MIFYEKRSWEVAALLYHCYLSPGQGFFRNPLLSFFPFSFLPPLATCDLVEWGPVQMERGARDGEEEEEVAGR